jgi:hypothetical protein
MSIRFKNPCSTKEGPTSGEFACGRCGTPAPDLHCCTGLAAKGMGQQSAAAVTVTHRCLTDDIVLVVVRYLPQTS